MSETHRLVHGIAVSIDKQILRVDGVVPPTWYHTSSYSQLIDRHGNIWMDWQRIGETSHYTVTEGGAHVVSHAYRLSNTLEGATGRCTLGWLNEGGSEMHTFYFFRGSLAYGPGDPTNEIINYVAGAYNMTVNHATIEKDVEVETTAKGFIWKSSNGTRFRLTVNNAGVLAATAV